MSITESIRDYLLTCPLLLGKRINVNYLGAHPVCYTVDNLPAEPLIKRYTDGGEIRQLCFAFASREGYDESQRENMDIAVFLEELASWIETQNALGNFPDLPNDLIAQKIEVTKSGYLFDSAGTSARFQLEFRLIYKV